MRWNELLARCQSTGSLFFITLEQEDGGPWIMKRAFEAEECVADNIGPQETLVGTFLPGPSYRGCPTCGSTGFVVCGRCGKASCYDGGNTFRCAWCRNGGKVAQTGSMKVSGGGL